MKLESITKYIFLIGLSLLMFRNGSFGATGIPKLFESVMVIVVLLTVFDLVRNKKIREFFFSIPRNVRIALGVLYGSIGVGWIFALFVRHIPFAQNTLYEIGMVSVAVTTFLLVLFYSRHHQDFARECFYTLLVPAIFVLCIAFPSAALFLDVARGAVFKGFSDNVEIISKILLVPGMFFITYAVFEHRWRWYRIVSVVMAIAFVALIFWTTERAAMLALAGGSFVVWALAAMREKNWKKIVGSAGILIAVLAIGFLVVPHQGKKAAIDRALNTDANQSGYEKIKDSSVSEVFQNSVTTPKTSIIDSEPRFRIWKYYLDQVLHNPLGLGPNTHMDAEIFHPRRTFINPGPHNAYLQIWLWGGIVGLVAFMYILANSYAHAYRRFREQPTVYILALLGSLAALSTTIFFNDNLSSYWLWVLLAVSLRL
jgi:hypothetical protein